MGCNIVFKCDNDSLMFQNPFLTRFLIHPRYTRKKEMMVFNDILVSRIIGQKKT